MFQLRPTALKTMRSRRITFLEAERLRCHGKLEAAESRYRQATERAKAVGFACEQALILEKHAELLMALGRVDDARATAEESIVHISPGEPPPK